MAGLTRLVVEKLGPLGVHQELHPFIPSLDLPTNGHVEVRALCPFHPDHRPSWCWNLAKGLANCPVCGLGGRSLVSFIAERTNRTKIAVLDDYCRRLGLPRPRQRILTVADYAHAKKLPESFLRSQFQLRDSVDGMVIPYLDSNKTVLAERYRKTLGKKPRWRNGAKASSMVYGLHRLDLAVCAPFLIVCEGESDLQTAAFHDLPALATPGASTSNKAMADFVCRVAPSQVFVAAHADAPGWFMAERLAKGLLLGGYKGECRKLSFPVKDLSELHCESPNHFRDIVLSALQRAVSIEEALADRRRVKESGSTAFREITRRILQKRGLNPSDRILLVSAAEKVADDPSQPIGVSNSKLAKAAGVTRRTLQNRLPHLVEAGLFANDSFGLRLGMELVKDLP